MSSYAAFTIDADPSANRGYDAAPAAVLSFQLEAIPSPDVTACSYALVKKSNGAPNVTFSTALGVASPPTAVVTATLDAGVGIWAYWFRSSVSVGDGSIPLDAEGKPDPSMIKFDRVVVIRGTSTSLRAFLPGETYQYSAWGWVEACREIAMAVEALAAGELLVDPNEKTVNANGVTAVDLVALGSRSIKLVLLGNSTVAAPFGVAVGGEYSIQVQQGAGGPYTLAWNAVFKSAGASLAPSAVAGAIDEYRFRGDTGGIMRLCSPVVRGVQV